MPVPVGAMTKVVVAMVLAYLFPYAFLALMFASFIVTLPGFLGLLFFPLLVGGLIGRSVLYERRCSKAGVTPDPWKYS